MKRTYAKPQVRKVKLVPSEAVLLTCKGVGQDGPQPNSLACIIQRVDPCQMIGS